MRIVYIEGFSDGPGFPYPLLTQHSVSTSRMPYAAQDIFQNPYVLLLLFLFASGVYTIKTVFSLSIDAGWKCLFVFLLLVAIFFLGVAFKRAAVGYCIDECIETYHKKIVEVKPDICIGYSWGGGVLCGLLNRALWDGPSLLIAPAGEQMWCHSGHKPPTLHRDALPVTATIITVQGDRDPVVHIDEIHRLHLGSEDVASSTGAAQQVELLVVRGGDHLLSGIITTHNINTWLQLLVERAASRRRYVKVSHFDRMEHVDNIGGDL